MKRVFCKNCKYCKWVAFEGYICLKAPLEYRYTFWEAILHYQPCHVRNKNNDCKLYKPKLWVRIKKIFNKMEDFQKEIENEK